MIDDAYSSEYFNWYLLLRTIPLPGKFLNSLSTLDTFYGGGIGRLCICSLSALSHSSTAQRTDIVSASCSSLSKAGRSFSTLQ